MATPFKAMDVERLLQEKGPSLYRRLPPGVMALLKGILREKKVNRWAWAMRDLEGDAFVKRLLEKLQVKIEIQHLDRIPKDEKITIVSNHPSGGIDGLLLLYLSHQARSQGRILVNDVLFELPQLASLFVPIDKFTSGSGGQRGLGTVDHFYQGSEPVLLFPAGKTSRPRKGKLWDEHWQSSFVRKSREHRRTIIPVHIETRNSQHFYWIWKLRSLFGLRANLEMFLLVDELFRQKGRTITLRVGKPRREHWNLPRKEDRAFAWNLYQEVHNLPNETKES